MFRYWYLYLVSGIWYLVSGIESCPLITVDCSEFRVPGCDWLLTIIFCWLVFFFSGAVPPVLDCKEIIGGQEAAGQKRLSNLHEDGLSVSGIRY